MSLNERLRFLIKLDFDKISTWGIAKTLEMLERLHLKKSGNNNKLENQTFDDLHPWTSEGTKKILNQIKKSELPDEVFLSLFRKDELVYTTAAKIIFDENPQKCFEYLNKMSPTKKELIKTLNEGGVLLQDKVKLLRRYYLFFSIPDYLLVELAEIITVNNLQKNEKVYFNNEGSEDIFILLRGELISNKNADVEKFTKKTIITPGLNIDKNTECLIATKKTVVLTVNRYKYFNLLVDNTKILQHIFEIIQ
jgi:hypothetical protein